MLLEGRSCMSRANGNQTRRTCHFIFLLTKKPRTVRELCELTGMHKAACMRWLNDLQDEGLLSSQKLPSVEGRIGDRARLWTWVGGAL